MLFGKFGNRFVLDDPRARYPVSVEVVADATPLQLMGPNLQRFVAVGLKAMSNGIPYMIPRWPPSAVAVLGWWAPSRPECPR